jgi:hypothetical protein
MFAKCGSTANWYHFLFVFCQPHKNVGLMDEGMECCVSMIKLHEFCKIGTLHLHGGPCWPRWSHIGCKEGSKQCLCMWRGRTIKIWWTKASSCMWLSSENGVSSGPEVFQTVGTLVNCHWNFCHITLRSESISSSAFNQMNPFSTYYLFSV